MAPTVIVQLRAKIDVAAAFNIPSKEFFQTLVILSLLPLFLFYD